MTTCEPLRENLIEVIHYILFGGVLFNFRSCKERTSGDSFQPCLTFNYIIPDSCQLVQVSTQQALILQLRFFVGMLLSYLVS